MCGYCGAVPLFRPREVYFPSCGADMSAAVQSEHAMGARVAALAVHAHARPPVTTNTATAVAFTGPRRHPNLSLSLGPLLETAGAGQCEEWGSKDVRQSEWRIASGG